MSSAKAASTAHGKMEAFHYLREVWKDLHQTDELQHSEQSEKKQYAQIPSYSFAKKSQKRWNRQGNQNKVHPVPSIPPIGAKSIRFNLHDHFCNKDNRAEGINQLQPNGIVTTDLKVNDNRIEDNYPKEKGV